MVKRYTNCCINYRIQEEKKYRLRVKWHVLSLITLGPHSEFQVSQGHTVRLSQKQEQSRALGGKMGAKGGRHGLSGRVLGLKCMKLWLDP